MVRLVYSGLSPGEGIGGVFTGSLFVPQISSNRVFIEYSYLDVIFVQVVFSVDEAGTEWIAVKMLLP